MDYLGNNMAYYNFLNFFLYGLSVVSFPRLFPCQTQINKSKDIHNQMWKLDSITILVEAKVEIRRIHRIKRNEFLKKAS